MSLEETCTQPLFLLLMIQVKCLYYKYIKRSLLLEIMTVNSHLKSVTHTKDTINYYFSFFNELEHSLISEYFINLGVDVFWKGMVSGLKDLYEYNVCKKKKGFQQFHGSMELIRSTVETICQSVGLSVCMYVFSGRIVNTLTRLCVLSSNSSEVNLVFPSFRSHWNKCNRIQILGRCIRLHHLIRALYTLMNIYLYLICFWVVSIYYRFDSTEIEASSYVYLNKALFLVSFVWTLFEICLSNIWS